MQINVDGHAAYAYSGARTFDPALPSVLFVHGAGLDHSVWILQSRWFAHHGFNAVAVDLPGHGRSGGAALPDIASMGAWIVACMDALGVQRACIAGHSMGSLAVLEAAAQAPARAAAVALLGVAVPMPVAAPLLDAARANDHAAIDMITLWGHGYPAQVGGNTAPGMWMTGSAVRLLERAAPGLLHNDLAACNAYDGGLEAAARIASPALVLLGRQDIMASPRNVAPLLAALPHGRLVELDPCGHMMMAEQPDGVLDALASHFTGARDAPR